ncbi:MAG: methyltransferase domain-containing protein [Deltaproteobacteria bacterium]|nr:methyltransferase domain-containing protein [Deltaproteobacteria bacterium]
MKEKILNFLACPECGGMFDLKVAAMEDLEIKDGCLSCKNCGKAFPIKDFIPRFVDTDKYVDSFSFEWNKFYDVQMDILNNTDESEKTFLWKTGWKPEDMKGKLILDVGVGAGRFADVVSRWGGEVVGIDLSFAVEAAYKNIGQRDNVHIIQADIFHLPFRKETFNLAYSIGVLHHTPDTKKAFQSVVPFLKKGGEFAVFIYGYGHYHYFSDIWRKITTKLPIRLMYLLSSVAVPLYYIHNIPFFGKAAQFLLPTANWPDRRWRWLDTFDWYTPKYQWKHTWPEVFKWYKEERFTNIELYDIDKESSLCQICMRGKKN